MKLYTRILLGMVVGAVIGLTLGPTSELLEHDTYKIDAAGAVTLVTDPDDPASALPVPARAALRLEVLETRTVTRADPRGGEHVLPGAVRVRFELSQRMALLDKGDALRARLAEVTGRPARIGDPVEAWLLVEHLPLAGGGFVVSPRPVSGLGDTVITWLAPIGTIFMRLLRLVIVPLVFASLLVGVAGLGDVRRLGRLGGKTLGLYMITTAVAVTIGLACAHLIGPGRFVGEKDKEALRAQFEGAAGSRVDAAADAPTPLDNLLQIIPENPIESLATGNMLQIIFFAVLLGVALTMIGRQRASPFIDMMDTLQRAMIVVIHLVMLVAPFGVAALLADVVGRSGWSVLQALVVYAITVLIGLALHAGLAYGGLVRFVARIPLPAFLRAARPAQLIAFSTSSSSAALPVTMECAEKGLGMSRAVSSFVLPLGSTVNMDGTALYQGVAAIFIAQVFGIELSLGAQLGIVFTATMASIGAAGVPGAGMITLAMVLTAAGIPPVGVALILGVDRVLDMFRTVVNITGDLAVASAMAASEGETLGAPGADAAR
jgi:proton glutamate symport protein